MITSDNWSQLANILSSKNPKTGAKDPLLHSPAAMDRTFRGFKPYIIQAQNPPSKFHSINRCLAIPFETEEDYLNYKRAWTDYEEECAKLNKETPEGKWAFIVATNKFRIRADKIKSRYYLKRAKQKLANEKAAVICTPYRTTISSIIRLAVTQEGMSRDDFSLIWGGDDAIQAKPLTPQEMKAWLRKGIEGGIIPAKVMRQITNQIIETESDKELREATAEQDLRLGNQSRKARIAEKNRFQTGKTKICCFTAAGGAGITLGHMATDDFGNKVNLLPRDVDVAPVYSAQDIIQFLGRSHGGHYSLSDTYQTILYFDGTVEVIVMEKVQLKMRCISTVLKQKQDWSSVLGDAVGKANMEDMRKAIVLQDDVEMAKMGEDTLDQADQAINTNIESEDEEDEDEAES